MLQKFVYFLREQVDGRNLFTKQLTYRLNGGELEGVYSDQLSFCNLLSGVGFCSLDLFVIAKEQVFRLDAAGRRAEKQKDIGAVSLFRYELAQRNSTEEVTGTFRCVSARGKEVYARAGVSGLSEVVLEGGAWSLLEDQALYRDLPAKDGGFRPVAFRARQRLSTDGYPPFHSIER